MDENSKNKEESTLESFITILTFPPLFVLIPGLTVTACLGTIGWQIFSYLSSGVWQSISLIDGLSLIFQNTGFGLWLEKPDSWYGVYELMNWLPLTVGIVITGIIIEIVWGFFSVTLLSAIDNVPSSPSLSSRKDNKIKKKYPDWVWEGLGLLVGVAMIIGAVFVLSFFGVAI